ncbi:MAG: hypothetical protein M1818_005873 [Claussenomyces sp. TS43310]|nr:MAG: hypothetical protein M1818_005873 [Claussenomyces sp. TS43310]
MAEPDGTSIIQCMCGETQKHQDCVKLWVQCQACSVWQHAVCVDVKVLPESNPYWCERCKPENHHQLLLLIDQPWRELLGSDLGKRLNDTYDSSNVLLTKAEHHASSIAAATAGSRSDPNGIDLPTASGPAGSNERISCSYGNPLTNVRCRNRLFKDEASLKRHIATYHGWTQWKYCCPICNRNYTRAHTVREHLAAKHPDVATPFQVLVPRLRLEGLGPGQGNSGPAAQTS